MKEFIEDLRSRINPAYADQPGTESFERKLCADVIERLDMELTAATIRIDNDVMRMGDLVKERDALAADAMRYRWLRADPTFLGWDEDYSPTEIDEQIDIAMKGGVK